MKLTKFACLILLLTSFSLKADSAPTADDPAWYFASQFTYNGYSIGGLEWTRTLLPLNEANVYFKVVKPSYCYPNSTITVSIPNTAVLNYVYNDRTANADNFIFAVNNGYGSTAMTEISLGYNGYAGESCTYSLYRIVANHVVTPPPVNPPPVNPPPVNPPPITSPYPEGMTTAQILLKPVVVDGVTTHKWAYESCYEGIRRLGMNITKIYEDAPFRLTADGDGKALYNLPTTLSCVQSISWNR